MRKIIFLLFTYANIVFVSAQDIEVKKFEPLEKDQTAALSPRKDINGVTCGLVKVTLKEPGAEFEGSVMGDVQFTGNEYLVYMPNGSKRLGIKHPGYLPTTVVFADYGTKKVASSTTYELKVKTNKKKAKVDNSKKGMAVFNIKPSNAMLLIDGQIADGSGGAYTLSLPYGTHYYTVKLKDFSINNQVVQIDKNAKNINVDLTEFFAKVSITCASNDVFVYVDNELMGSESWEGILAPGKHVVEATKDGYHAQSKTIEIEENSLINIRFDNLKALIGGIKVLYKPSGTEVYLDEVKIGTTPLERNNVPVGNHQLKVRKKSGIEKTININVFEDKILEIDGVLPMSDIEVLMEEVTKGNGCAMNILGQYYAFDHELSSIFDGPCSECATDLDVYVSKDENARQLWIDADSKTNEDCIRDAIMWFEKALTANFRSGHEVGKYYAMLALSECHARLGHYNDSFLWAKKCYDEYKGEGWITSYYLAWHYFNGKGTASNSSLAKQLLNRVTGNSPKNTLELISKLSEQKISPNELTNYWHFSLSYQQSYGY